MIELPPISNQRAIKETVRAEKSLFPSPFPLGERSSIFSLNPIHWLEACFSTLLTFLSKFFCCFKQPADKGGVVPELHPNILAKNDPFRRLVFAPDGSFLSQEAFDKTSILFHFLGTTSYFTWIAKALWLKQQEKEVRSLLSHPLQFLYYLFCNREKTLYIVHLEKEALRGKWLLQLKTGRNPWEEFLTQEAQSMGTHKNHPNLLPGFCKALCLNEKKAIELAKAKKWRELLLFIYEERKAHFHLS